MNIGRAVRQLMRADAVRAAVLLARYFWFVRILRRLRVWTDPSAAVSANTIKYNLSAFSRPLLLQRTRLLIRPLTVIETLGPDAAILVVGPRSEDDLLHLSAYGFRNVRGLDLISYSPRIDLGDMHEMPYAEGTFDALLYGWVLGYSDDPQRAAREAVRVLRDGGIVGIGAEHYPSAELLARARTAGGVDYATGGRRINSAAEHLALFGDRVGQVFFMHDVGERVTDRMSNTCAIFAVRK